MSKRKKIFLYLLVGIIVLIQFYPVERPAVNTDNPNDISKHVNVPKNISIILKSSCYDCHSNETVYPWYANIAPVKWWVYEHIEHGREHLNFSEWSTISKLDKAEILDDLSSEVIEKEMPLKYYPWMHKEAKLSDADREALSEWAEMLAEGLFE
jgi:hypothetical protein